MANDPQDDGRDENEIKEGQTPVPEGKLTDEATLGLQKAQRKSQPFDERVRPVPARNQRLRIPPRRSENIVEIGEEWIREMRVERPHPWAERQRESRGPADGEYQRFANAAPHDGGAQKQRETQGERVGRGGKLESAGGAAQKTRRGERAPSDLLFVDTLQREPQSDHHQHRALPLVDGRPQHRYRARGGDTDRESQRGVEPAFAPWQVGEEQQHELAEEERAYARRKSQRERNPLGRPAGGNHRV